MTNAQGTEIAVVGAGVIGPAIGHRLALQGHEVVMIDPETPGAGGELVTPGTPSLSGLPRRTDTLHQRNQPVHMVLLGAK